MPLRTTAPRTDRMASRLPLSISPTADRLIRPHGEPVHPFEWPTAHHGMRYSQNDPTTHLERSTDRQAGQAQKGPATVLALKLPPGASVLAIEHRRICAADRGQTPGHRRDRQPDMHLITLLPRNGPRQEQACTEITEHSAPHPNLGSRPEAPDARANTIFTKGPLGNQTKFGLGASSSQSNQLGLH